MHPFAVETLPLLHPLWRQCHKPLQRLSVLPTAMWKKGKSQIATMDGWINWHDDDATVAGLCAVVILIVVAIIVLCFTYQQMYLLFFFSLPSIFGLSVMLF